MKREYTWTESNIQLFAIGFNKRAAAMNNVNQRGILSPSRIEGKNMALVASWFLGLGSLVSWNSLLTIEDYYYDLFPYFL
ncbi:equilibrative nucleotide transporter 7-like [Olea europaea var. sylvestris]|uniref:equilibrative nucleotide transporter 7-like n=1 Tax=Olea europaea var. sylvestris TaxID=158386 RepID=UPI000C1D7B67|nr:equilibrative nucleotide transporter 7-like [Olea europaea var. sylvestris]